jgi:hypothetical protein
MGRVHFIGGSPNNFPLRFKLSGVAGVRAIG